MVEVMPEAAAHAPFADPLTARIAAFLGGIGIPVLPAELPDGCFLPGIRLDGGRLLVDEARLLHPGDLLHEAGHIAAMIPERRAGKRVDASKSLGDEIGAIAWSWAALTHLGLPPETVFHAAGYRGASRWHIATFSGGNYPGLPLLQWMGLTLDARAAQGRGLPPFPHMLPAPAAREPGRAVQGNRVNPIALLLARPQSPAPASAGSGFRSARRFSGHMS